MEFSHILPYSFRIFVLILSDPSEFSQILQVSFGSFQILFDPLGIQLDSLVFFQILSCFPIFFRILPDSLNFFRILPDSRILLDFSGFSRVISYSFEFFSDYFVLYSLGFFRIWDFFEFFTNSFRFCWAFQDSSGFFSILTERYELDSIEFSWVFSDSYNPVVRFGVFSDSHEFSRFVSTFLEFSHILWKLLRFFGFFVFFAFFRLLGFLGFPRFFVFSLIILDSPVFFRIFSISLEFLLILSDLLGIWPDLPYSFGFLRILSKPLKI